MAKPKKEYVDVYQRVTDSIIASLEQGVRPWAKPWTDTGPKLVTLPLRANGKPYRGINVFLLWSDSVAKGFSSPFWLTYNQVEKLAEEKRAKLEKAGVAKVTVDVTNKAGEVIGTRETFEGLPHVKKGEKGSFVVYASTIVKPKKDDPSKEEKIFFMKGYTVFNADQCENLPEKYCPAPVVLTETETKKATVARIAHAEEFFGKIGGTVKHAPNRAYYSPAGDFISLPEVDDFKDGEGYYATLGHEYVHWTGPASRLNREFGRFGDEAYAREELVAELGSAFLCAHLGIALTPREDHAAYLASWLKVLKGDKRFIVQAASKAQKAVEYLRDLAGEGEVQGADEEELAEAA